MWHYNFVHELPVIVTSLCMVLLMCHFNVPLCFIPVWHLINCLSESITNISATVYSKLQPVINMYMYIVMAFWGWVVQDVTVIYLFTVWMLPWLSRLRVVLRAPRFSPSLPLLKQLHWLPVNYRIQFKLSTLTYRALAIHQHLILLVFCTFLTSPDNSDHLPHSSFLFPEQNWTWASVLSLLLHPLFGMNSQPH